MANVAEVLSSWRRFALLPTDPLSAEHALRNPSDGRLQVAQIGTYGRAHLPGDMGHGGNVVLGRSGGVLWDG